MAEEDKVEEKRPPSVDRLQDSIADIGLSDLEHRNPTRKWFAEGMAAEQALEDLRSSAPLPALYDQAEEPSEPRPSVTALIMLGVTVIVLLLAITFFLVL